MKTYSIISGVGTYLPQNIVTNADLERQVQTSDAWIRERTGIRQRHIAADNELCSDLATHAAREALHSAGLTVDQLDMIIVATSTPDQVFPSTACSVQRKLGAHGGPAFDISAACSGFIYALSIADQFVRSAQVRNALVIGAETYSRILDWNDRATCVLFGDGAGAVVLQQNNAPGIYSTHIHSDGQYQDLLGVPWGVSCGFDRPGEISPYVAMRGNEVFKVAVKTLAGAIDKTLNANGLTRDDHFWLVPHQANIRIIEATAKRIGLDPARVIVTVDKHANTSAASIPLALFEGISDGRIRSGDLVMMEAFGGGFTWGSALVRM